MNKVYLLLGGNLGERFSLITKAKYLINEQIGEVIKESSLYETEPWGFEASQSFLNQVIKVNTDLQAQSILKICLEIESELGRERNSTQYSSRTMDIDILFYNDDIINANDLVIPHPRLHERRFTLEPLSEIIPDFIHPKLDKPIKQLLLECKDDSEVHKLK